MVAILVRHGLGSLARELRLRRRPALPLPGLATLALLSYLALDTWRSRRL